MHTNSTVYACKVASIYSNKSIVQASVSFLLIKYLQELANGNIVIIIISSDNNVKL